MADDSSAGNVVTLPIASLRLDWRNPRLPAEIQRPEVSQQELATYINKQYNPLGIAESISRHEYFESEPLIAVPDQDVFTVIEGNRRLTALLGLSDESLYEIFAQENRGWRSLAVGSGPTEVPVLIVADSASVAPLLGFRHISGIEPWDAHAQARYIGQLVEDGHSLHDVADLVGRELTEVRAMYRDYAVLEQAEEMFDLDTVRARKSFGVFNNAMGRTGIRGYIGASAPRFVSPDYWPLPESSGPNLGKLLIFMFGDTRGEGRILHDSRQLGQLARVLADDTGDALAVLDDGGDLSEALEALEDPDDRLMSAARQALKHLERTRKAAGSRIPHVAQNTIREIVRIASELDGLEKGDA